MRVGERRSLLLGALALLAASFFVGCDNPIDPLDKSDKIQGLTYVDFAAAWDRWDSDPEFDGMVFTLDYSNEFGDALSFHDKPHDVVIEFWTERRVVDDDDNAFTTRDELFFTKTIVYSNSDDDIRIPIEAYFDAIKAKGFDTALVIKAFVLVRVFPPQGYPRTELIVGQPGVLLFQPPDASDTPNG